MLDLYHYENSVCSQKARMALFEKGLEWRSYEIDLFTHQQFDPNYLKLNPKGYVPTLVHDGKSIRESTLICEYLDDFAPSPPLMPSDPHKRVLVRLWSKAVDEGLFEGVTVFSFSAMFRDRMKSMSDEQRERRYRNVGNPTRRDRHISMFEYGVDSPYVFRAVAAYETAVKEMEEALTGGLSWLVDDMFSLAEVNLAPFFARLEYLTLLDLWIKERPNVTAWWKNLKNRPSYQSQIHNLVTAQEYEEMQVTGARIKPRVAEIRSAYLEWS